MKELLEKYKNGTLNDATEQDEFVHQLLEIRAQRMQQKGQSQQPVASIKTINPLRAVWFTRLALAASLLLGSFFLWQWNQPAQHSDSLLASDIEQYSKGLEQQVRGGENSAMQELPPQLIKLYENDDYQGIISELGGKVLEKEQEKLYLGIAYANLEKPNFDKALYHLKQIQSPEYQQKVKMLIALCHIGLAENGAAKDILNTIINDDNSGKEDKNKAEILLKKMEQ